MRAFLKFLSEDVWMSVQTGWTGPDETFDKWNKEHLATLNLNNQGLNAIFIVLSSGV